MTEHCNVNKKFNLIKTFKTKMKNKSKYFINNI